MAGLFGFSAIAISGALALNHSGLIRSMLARAGTQASGSYTLTAADFQSGNGDISICGVNWHYNGAAISGDTVTISSTMYTSSFSGQSSEGGRRGNGYTRMVLGGLNLENASGLVYHLKDVNGVLTKAANTVSTDADLTFGGTVASADRRGLEFAQGAGSSFSFTSLTMYYDCVDVSPEVHITETEMTVGVGETGQLHTSTVDVSEGDGATYSWASDDEDVATVDSNGLVTGVGAGSANITVTMTIGENTYTDSLEVSVTAAPATVVPLGLGAGSNIVGNQVFTYFDTTSTGKTAAEITALGLADSSVSGIDNTIQSNEIQGVNGNNFRIYSPMKNGAVGLTNAFVLTYDFRDSANNIIYRAIAHYDGGKIENEIKLSASSFSVVEGADLVITASKASWLEGTPSFSFESLDNNVFTVTNEGNVATVTGGTEGSATLRVVMIIDGVDYTLDKTIAVTKAGVEHLITWRTDGEGNQRNWWEGAGIWTWVNYGELGYDGFAAFAAQKGNMTATYESEPATTIRVEVISDDLASLKVCRVYLVAGGAYNTGKLTMTIPDVNGVTYTGSITFVDGEATAYNA